MKALGSLALAACMLSSLAFAGESPDPNLHVEGEAGQSIQGGEDRSEERASDPRDKVKRLFRDFWGKLELQGSEEGEPLDKVWVPYDPTCHVEEETIAEYVRRIANLDEPPGRLERFSRRFLDSQELQRTAKEVLESPETRKLAGSTAAGAGLAMGLVGAGSLGASGLSGAAATAATLATIGGAVGGGMIAGTGVLMVAPVIAGLYAHRKLSKGSGGEGDAGEEAWQDCWEPLLRTSR